MHEDDNSILAEYSLISDHRCVTVTRLGYGWVQVGIGAKPPLHTIPAFDNTWIFASHLIASKALFQWHLEDAEEPDYWFRHVQSRRHRIGGDRHYEYVEDAIDAPLWANLIWAIKITQGEERIILEIKEDTKIIGPVFPNGTRFFRVVSESSTCTCNPKCGWTDHIYRLGSRSVVVGMNNRSYSPKNVIDRLIMDDGAK